MKVIIAGSRTFWDETLVAQVLGQDHQRITQILHGGAQGADRCGFRWAWRHHVPSRCFRADWARYGKAAGPRRNAQLAQAGDVLVAFWDGQSPGTRDMIRQMQALQKPVVIVQV